MSESQEPRAALVSPEDKGTILALIGIDKETMGCEHKVDPFTQAQEVIIRVAQ